MATSVYDFSVNRINGKPATIGEYRGKVLLFVNVASKCGLTPQYEALEKVYEKYHDKGLEVLGFPANDFLSQEPGTNDEIQQFCQASFGVKFPLFEKISVKGEGKNSLYKYLTEQMPKAQLKAGSNFEDRLKSHGQVRTNPSEVLWNFEKFLADRNGKIIARFAPDITPDDPMITSAIEAALK